MKREKAKFPHKIRFFKARNWPIMVTNKFEFIILRNV